MTAALIAGIIVAAVGGIVATADSIIDDTQNIKEAERNMNYLDAKNKNDLAIAELQFNQAKEEAEKNAKRKEEQADLTDKQQTVAETGLSADYNATINNIENQQLADTYNWNYYAMQAGAAEGKSQAALAASGVRSGSTMQQAIDMESAVNSQQLQLQEDSARRNYGNTIAAAGANLKGNMINIESNRKQADWNRSDAAALRDSYRAGSVDANGNLTKDANGNEIYNGGSNWNLYMANRSGINQTYQYNRQTQEKKREQSYGWNMVWHAWGASLTGSASGFQTGYNIGGAIENYGGNTNKNYTTDYKTLME